MEDVSNVLSSVLKVIESPAAIVIGGVVWDLIRRLSKTDKPASIAWSVVKLLNGMAKVCESLAKASSGLAVFLDKILPQNIKK